MSNASAILYPRRLACLLVALCLALVACSSSGGSGGPDAPVAPINTLSNAAPTLSELEDQTMGTLGALPTMMLQVADDDSENENLAVTVVSSDTDVVPGNGISLTEFDGVWTLNISQPRVDANDFGAVGFSNITITVSDGEDSASRTFRVEVVPRMNQFIAMGTHNSYHEEGPNSATVADWNYSHDTLDKQLNEHRVRSFELDIHWNEPGSYLQVYHVVGLDAISMCDRFSVDPTPAAAGCLEMIKAGVENNPNTLPTVIMIETKDTSPEDPNPNTLKDHWREFDAEIRAVFPKPAEGEVDPIITPAEVIGSCDNLAQAISFDSTCGGWPALDKARGRVLVLLLAEDCSERGRAYREQTEGDCDRSNNPFPVENWTAFLEVSEGPNAGAVRCDGPTGSCAGFGTVAEAVQNGFLVRTRSDSPPTSGAETCANFPPQESCTNYIPVCEFDYGPEVAGYRSRLQQALASGAQIISTEHPAHPYPDDEVNECPNNASYAEWLEYFATVDGAPTKVTTGLAALCNPANKPRGCVDTLFND